MQNVKMVVWKAVKIKCPVIAIWCAKLDMNNCQWKIRLHWILGLRILDVIWCLCLKLHA